MYYRSAALAAEMHMPKLSTVGLDMPDDFPATEYEKTFAVVRVKRDTDPLFQEFGGAWNAVAYRYQAMIDAGDSFANSIKLCGTSPPPNERYGQEKNLLEFFSAGFATFEAAFYGLYAIGAMVAASGLTLATPRDRQAVSPSKTQAALARVFPNDAAAALLATVIADDEFKAFRETRNVLTHRTAPGRTMFVGIGGYDEVPTEWKLNNQALDASISTRGRAQVSRLLTALAAISAEFAQRNL
jgi:hypothetical protein